MDTNGDFSQILIHVLASAVINMQSKDFSKMLLCLVGLIFNP